MLDQIALSRAFTVGIVQKFTHHIKLMVTRPDLSFLLLSGLFILYDHHLGIVFDDVCQALPCQNLFPQVVNLEAVGVGGIAGAIVPALVERQEPRCLALQVSTELYFLFIYGKMRHTAAKFEQLFVRVAVAPILLNCIFNRLLGQVILQLKGEYRQAVDEQSEVKRVLRICLAVMQLPGNRKTVHSVSCRGLLIAR